MSTVIISCIGNCRFFDTGKPTVNCTDYSIIDPKSSRQFVPIVSRLFKFIHRCGYFDSKFPILFDSNKELINYSDYRPYINFVHVGYQGGPLAVIRRSYRDAIPATAYLMKLLILNNNSDSSYNDGDGDTSPSLFLTGRILRNVNDPKDLVLSGRFVQQNSRVPLRRLPTTDDDKDAVHLQPYWFFESDSWNIMVCPLTLPPSPREQNDELNAYSSEDDASKKTPALSHLKDQQAAVADALRLSIDNLRFRLGNAALSKLDIFLNQPFIPPSKKENDSEDGMALPAAFAAGNPSGGIAALYREIRQTRVFLPAPRAD